MILLDAFLLPFFKKAASFYLKLNQMDIWRCIIYNAKCSTITIQTVKAEVVRWQQPSFLHSQKLKFGVQIEGIFIDTAHALKPVAHTQECSLLSHLVHYGTYLLVLYKAEI